MYLFFEQKKRTIDRFALVYMNLVIEGKNLLLLQ